MLNDPKDEKVGVGPLYEPLRAIARNLIPLFSPGGIERAQNWWGCGPFGMVHEDNGECMFVEVFPDDWEKRALGINKSFDIDNLRACAISLLVYCEAYGRE